MKWGPNDALVRNHPRNMHIVGHHMRNRIRQLQNMGIRHTRRGIPARISIHRHIGILHIEARGDMVKAHINGITIEGTPEEIAAYQRIKAEETRQPFKEPWRPPDDGRAWIETPPHTEPKFMLLSNSGKIVEYPEPNTADWYHSEPGYRIGTMRGQQNSSS